VEWIDGISVAVRAAAFVAALQAAGLSMFTLLVRRAAPASVATLHRLIRITAPLAAVLVVTHRLLDGGRMAGDWNGIVDAHLQALLWSRRPGMSTAACAAGLLAVAASAPPRGGGRVVMGCFGIVSVIGSFALTGHTTEAHHAGALRVLLTLHVGIAAFWIGAVAGLHRMSRGEPGVAGASSVAGEPVVARARVPELSRAAVRFSTVAVWMVPLMLPAGLLMMWGLLPDWRALLTPYGGMLLLKLIGFCSLMALAARNRLRLVPALSTGSEHPVRDFRRSLVMEHVLLGAVLAVTAAMTSLFSWQ
jgi:putative copper resistance protein D